MENLDRFRHSYLRRFFVWMAPAIATSAVLVLSVLCQGSGYAQEVTERNAEDDSPPRSAEQAEPRGADVTPEEAARILLEQLEPPQESLRFGFEGASWRDVLSWLATEGDLALQIDRYPAGSVTFTDKTRTYTVNEALDLLNRMLLDRGYALVRRGRMLFLIDLEVDNADKLVSELAELVRPEELESRGKSDIVTAIFPLGSMTPEDAKVQLPQMIGPWGRVIVLDSARQAKVTERAEKLIGIRDVIRQSAQEVHEIKLVHRGAEELLQTARPLLGLEPAENSNDDIRIAVGLYGDRIYATGLPAKISILENLISKADQPLEGVESETEAEVARPVFDTHFVRTADPATVFDVLQTLLQDEPNTRVAIDPETNAIVAFGTAATHQKIESVIAKMEGSGEGFQVFQLNRIDPAQALLTINKYFGVTEEGGGGPVVDGDPSTGKLWVRGSQDEIDQVERLLMELDGSGSEGFLSGKVRLLPINGRQAEDALRQLQLYWRMTGRDNPIRVVSPSGSGSNNAIRERRLIRPSAEGSRPASPQDSNNSDDSQIDAAIKRTATYYLVTAPADELNQSGQNVNQSGQSIPQAPADPAPSQSSESEQTVRTAPVADILIEITPAGLRIASDDTEALDELETLLSQLVTPGGTQSDLPTIFWLKYIKADVAADLVASILGGGDSSGGLTDTLAGGLGGGMLGGLMGLAGGGGGDESSAKSVLTTTGSVNIVPDLRLNALFINANEVDLQVIEMVLEKIDREESPEDIELTSTPRMIPVIYQDAAEVAKVVKEIYAERIGGAEQSQRGGRGGDQPSPQDLIAMFRGGRGGRGGGGGDEAKSQRSKITIVANTQSNSLIVTAPPQDFEEIELLVQALDEGGKVNEKTTMVLPLSGKMNGASLVQALEAVLGQQVQTKDSNGTASSDASGRPSGSGDNNAEAANAMRQRFIEAMRARAAGGDGGRGGGRPGGFGGRGGGGGSPFGGGGRPGGGGGTRGGRGGGR